jgi:protein-tyrosine phosphatase
VDRLRILFVCTGNVCRSPTAEGVLRYKARLHGLSSVIECDSAGTDVYHVGQPPSPRAIRRAALRGYDLRDLRARALTPEDFGAFHMMLAMDRGHLRVLRRTVRWRRGAQARLFLDYAIGLGGLREVPDPFNGDAGDYDHALDLIEAGCDGILQALQRKRA